MILPSFSMLLGNEEVKRQLSQMVSKRAVSHALLFAGPDGVGKSLFAKALTAEILAEFGTSPEQVDKIRSGQHPDLHLYRPEGKLGLHSIQSLRQLSEEVYLPPYEASWKVFIIYEAERMLSYSANALLKTFEEPPSRTLIILLSRSQSALLPTILSRCQTLHFQPLTFSHVLEFLKQNDTLDEQTCIKLAKQSNGSLARATRLAEQGEDATRSYLLNLLAQGPLGSYRLLQEATQVLGEQIESIKKQAEEAAKEELQQFSAQQQHILEKELEGLSSLALTQEAKVLFEHILSWYRDMHLLLLGGNSSQFINSDFYQEIEQAVQRGEVRPLEKVYQAVEDAYLALQRSTALPLCLESLFLKLNLV